MYYLYILHSDKTGRYYIGSTVNLANRVREHNSGKTPSTKGGIPWVLVYSESFSTLSEARRRESVRQWLLCLPAA